MTVFTTDEILAIAIAAQSDSADLKPAYGAMNKAGMIEERYVDQRFVGWKLTERGAVWFAAVLQLKAPERRWVMEPVHPTREKRRPK